MLFLLPLSSLPENTRSGLINIFAAARFPIIFHFVFDPDSLRLLFALFGCFMDSLVRGAFLWQFSCFFLRHDPMIAQLRGQS